MKETESKVWRIIEAIFEELKKNGKNTVNLLVRKTKLNQKTVVKYLKIIEMIQKQPKLILERTGHSYLVSLDKS